MFIEAGRISEGRNLAKFQGLRIIFCVLIFATNVAQLSSAMGAQTKIEVAQGVKKVAGRLFWGGGV